MAKRAYGREDKQEKRETILRAAAVLFGNGLSDLPSVAAIAEGAGLAKGTVYLYFRTKEAIFSALLLEGWSTVIDLLKETFLSTLTKEQKTAVFLSAYSSYISSRRGLLRLDAQRSSLERNLDEEALMDFKKSFMERLIAGGILVEDALGLREGRGIQLLTRTHALTCGLWQSLSPDTKPIPLSEFAAYHPEFEQELSQALKEYWRGALME